MCGDSAFGLWSGDSLQMQALADFVGFDAPNDAVVELTSCTPAGATPGRDSASKYYTSGANHFDLTCRHGDGAFGGVDRRPCGWFAARSNESVYA